MMTRFEVGGWNTDAGTDGLNDSLFGLQASAHVSMHAYLNLAYITISILKFVLLFAVQYTKL